MNDDLKSIFKPFKTILIIAIIEFLILFMFFVRINPVYDRNAFNITINGIDMHAYYTEQYRSGIIPYVLELRSNITGGFNSVEPLINEINLTDSMFLDIKEFEVYYKGGNRKYNPDGWSFNDDYTYKKITSSDIVLEIKRMNEIIYSGDYIKELNKYISENGRYYVHIYVTRKENLITSIKTHISFNVIVGGGNYE